MGTALVQGWRASGVDLSEAVIVRPSGESVQGIPAVTRFADAGASPRLVILAFKPQQLEEAAPALSPWLTSQTIVVSILAGVELATLREHFPNAGQIVRALPNLPVSVRRGVVALYSEDADGAARDQLSRLFAPLGFALWTNSEASLAAIGSVAGAGPAYVARFIAALAKAAAARGLSEELAQTIALETVLGTAWMAASTNEGMDALVRRVASPKGTTEAGLAVLDTEDVLDKLLELTINAAARRGAELAEEARSRKLADPPSLP
jgi:pyrroline-5-carboxylate reductase